MDGWRTSFSVTHQFADSQDIVFREHYILVEVALAHEASVLYETSTNTNKDILKYWSVSPLPTDCVRVGEHHQHEQLIILH